MDVDRRSEASEHDLERVEDVEEQTKKTSTSSFSPSKAELYSLIIKQLEDDGLHRVAALLSEETSLQRHPGADFDHLHSLFDSCLEMLQDTNNATVAHRTLPKPTGSNPIRFGHSWIPVYGRTVAPALNDITLDYERPSKVLPLPQVKTVRQVFHPHSSLIHSVTFSKDGLLAASASTLPGVIKVIGIPRQDRSVLSEFDVGVLVPNQAPISALDFHWNVQTLFSGDTEGVLRAYDASGHNYQQGQPGQPGRVLLSDPTLPLSCIAVHPSNDFILLGSSRARHTSSANRKSFQNSAQASSSPEAQAEGGSPLRLFDVRTGRTFVATNREQDHRGSTTCMQWSKTGSFFATGGSDGVVALWDGNTMRRLNGVKLAHSGQAVTTVRILRNEHLLLSSGLDGAGRIWDLRMGKELMRLSPTAQVSSFSHACAVALHDERYVVVSATPLEGPRVVQVFNSTTAQRLELDMPIQDVYSMDASPTDNLITIGSLNGRAAVHEFRLPSSGASIAQPNYRNDMKYETSGSGNNVTYSNDF